MVKAPFLLQSTRGRGPFQPLSLGNWHLLYPNFDNLNRLDHCHLGNTIAGFRLCGAHCGQCPAGSGLIGFLIVQRKGKLGAVVRWIAARRGGGALKKWADYITKVDKDLSAFYRGTRWVCHGPSSGAYAGYCVSMLKTWYFLSLFTSEPFLTAAAVWPLSTWMDLLVFFIPLEIGVQESIRVVVFSVLGFSMALGLTYGIALRLEQLFWGCVGLLVYIALLPTREQNEVLPRVVAGEDN